jgi:hypothetical protein
MGDFALTSHNSTQGTTHCHQKMRVEIFTQHKKTRRNPMRCTTMYQFMSRNQTQKFPSVLVRILDDNGSPKTPPYL